MSRLRVNQIDPFSGPSIGVGGLPSSPSRILDIRSPLNNQGIGFPELTTAQRNAIANPADGTFIYNTNTRSLEHYNGLTSSWESTDGVQSINGLIAKNQILITGTSGLAPNWTQVGLDTHSLNIPSAVTGSVTAGLISNSEYVSFNSRLFPNKNVKYVTKNLVLGPQDYNSIKAAVDSISDASDTNQYLVVVYPGIYVEDQIDLPENVFVTGSLMDAVVVEPSGNSQHIFTVSSNSGLSFLSLRGAGTGFAAIVCDDAGNFTVVHKISISDCGIGVWCRSSSVDSFNYLEYVDVTGVEVGVVVESSNGFKSFASLENFHVYASDAGVNPDYAVRVVGPDAEALVVAATFEGSDGTGTAIFISDEGRVDLKAAIIRLWDTGLHLDGSGTGGFVSITGSSFYDNATNDIVIDNPAATAYITANATLDKCQFVAGLSLTLLLTDDEGLASGGVVRVKQSDNTFTDQTTLVHKASSMGVMQGGAISATGGLDISVSSGFGYLETAGGALKRYDWPATPLTLPSSASSYIFFNSSGVLTFSSDIPLTSRNILLGRVVTSSSDVLFIDSAGLDATHATNMLDKLLRRAIGCVYSTGSIVSESGTRNLDVTAGVRFLSTREFNTIGGTAITWDAYVGGSTSTTQSTVDNANYDDGGSLQPMTAGYFAKHLLYIVGEDDDGTEKYMLVYAQAEYGSLVEAEEATLPVPPTTFVEGVTPIASIIVQEGTSNIIQIRDERPRFGFSASGVSASATHGNLLGLDADDHLQYLPLNGIRAMTGDLNMGLQDIISVGLVDGVDVSAHASRHLPAGADPLTTAAPTASLSATTTNSVGVANSLSRSDHGHAILVGTPVTLLPDQANSAGSSAELARANHVHQIQTDIAIAITDSTNSQGVSSAFSRADHSHSHGSRGGGTLHAVATTSVAGFLSAADKVRIDSIETIADGRITLQKGQANGLATLGSDGKIPLIQIPDTVLGSVDYKGTWNANTNTPDLVAATPDKGDYYVVNVAGSTSLGGITDWKVGDWAIYNGTAWEKVDNTDQVTSVFGRQGAVTAADADYSASQIVYSNATSGLVATRVQTAIDEVEGRLDSAQALLNAHASRHLPAGADPLTTAAPLANLTATTTNSTGTANSLARSDHSHAISTAAAILISTSTTNTQGSSANLARADHTHAVNITNSEASATGDTTTTSATYGLMDSMTITPAAGTYFVSFSTTLNSSNNAATLFVSIFSGGVQKADSERRATPRVNASGGFGGNANLDIDLPIATNGVVTVNGSQAIEIRWRRDTGGTATAHQRTMNILKLS